MNIRLLRAVCLVLLLVLAISVPVLANSADNTVLGIATTSLSELNLLEAPDDSAEYDIAGVERAVLVLEADDIWAKISSDGQIGYVRSNILSIASSSDIGLGIGYTQYLKVNVRAQASEDSQVLATLNYGMAVLVTGITDGWYQLGDGIGGIVGYVQCDLVVLRDYPKDEAELTLLSTGDLEVTDNGDIYLGQEIDDDSAGELVDFAESLIGTPYSWGATGPDAFDCSGFVQYVFESFGYTLERTADNIYQQNGEYIDYEDLEPGDIVFFMHTYATSDTVTHIGIYIGNGEFIHASSVSGVTISELGDEYYASRYAGAKRVVQSVG